MTTSITITGLPAILASLERLDGRQQQNAMRRGVRAAGKVFGAELKSVAAGASVPRSFGKVMAPKITTHGGLGRSVEALVRPRSPLFNIFEPGAKSHTIAPKRSTVLAGRAGSGAWDRVGRKRRADFHAAGAVRHPGMAARPILPAAFARGAPAATDALAAVLFGAISGPVG